MQTALDRSRIAPPQATWTAKHVCERLVEAVKIERRLPNDRRGPSTGSQSAWPTMTHEFADMTGWGDEHREAVWGDWARAKGVHAWEVTRMEEALGWLKLLAGHIEERRYLEAWARASASPRLSLARVLRHLGVPKQTFYRRVKKAAQRIATELNARGAAVR